jgi:hypothetical protein
MGNLEVDLVEELQVVDSTAGEVKVVDSVEELQVGDSVEVKGEEASVNRSRVDTVAAPLLRMREDRVTCQPQWSPQGPATTSHPQNKLPAVDTDDSIVISLV